MVMLGGRAPCCVLRWNHLLRVQDFWVHGAAEDAASSKPPMSTKSEHLWQSCSREGAADAPLRDPVLERRRPGSCFSGWYGLGLHLKPPSAPTPYNLPLCPKPTPRVGTAAHSSQFGCFLSGEPAPQHAAGIPNRRRDSRASAAERLSMT